MNWKATLTVACLCLSATSQAAFHDRGGGLIYDDVLNITLLQDANYSAKELSDTRVAEIVAAVPTVGEHQLTTDDFFLYTDDNRPFLPAHPDGNWYMTWWGAVAWADQLSYGGYDDWRLFRTYFGQNGCRDFYCTTDGEPAHLIVMPPPDGLGGDIFSGPFENIQSFSYWTGPEIPEDPLYTLTYDVENRWYANTSETALFLAWAVRDGDVSAVPLPAAVWLFTSAVGLLGFSARRMQSRG